MSIYPRDIGEKTSHNGRRNIRVHYDMTKAHQQMISCRYQDLRGEINRGGNKMGKIFNAYMNK